MFGQKSEVIGKIRLGIVKENPTKFRLAELMGKLCCIQDHILVFEQNEKDSVINIQ